MSKTTIIEVELPLGLPVPVAEPTGNLYDTSKPYTLPMTQRVALARIIGPYTEIDRKLWVTLVALAWDDLAKKRIHAVNGRQIAKLFRDLKGARSGSEWVFASAQRLEKTSLVWEDENEKGTAPFLAGLKILKVSGEINYTFSDFLIEKLLNNAQFSRLRVHFMVGLSGKYSITLYMLLESAANRRNPTVVLSIDELRQVLSVPDGKLGRWVDLNRFAIEPAIKQINDNPSAAGFSVDVQPDMDGRKVVGVKFAVTKAAERVEEDTAIKLRISHRKAANAKAEEARPPAPRYQIDAALTVIRKHAPGLETYPILADFDAWLKTEKGKAVQNVLGALVELAKKRHKQHRLDFFTDEAAE